jgi:hypothetical protein
MNLTDWISAGASVINVLIVWKIAQLTERYAKATDNILKANQESVDTMRQASYGTTFVWVSELLSSKEILLCRRKVMEELPNYHGTLEDILSELRESFEQTCRTYDLAGIAGLNGMLPYEIIVKEWGNSIIRTYEACEPYIETLRKDRGKMYWNNFTELYEESKNIWE